MPVKEVAKFKCKECGDVFEATSEEYVSCKCGKCCVKPSTYSTSYMSNEGRGLYFERLESKTYYDEKDYLNLTRKTQLMWNVIKKLKFNDCYLHFYEGIDHSVDGNKYLRELELRVNKYLSNNVETNTLKLRIDLRRNYTNDQVFDRLKSFYEILKQVNKKEFDLSDVDLLKAKSQDWERTQCDYYDHTFYF
jgi:hypothetical protein